MSDSEIVDSMQLLAEADTPQVPDSEEKDDCGDEQPLVTHYEATNSLQRLRMFVAQRDGDSDLLDYIGRLERLIDHCAMKNKYQPTLSSYFK